VRDAANEGKGNNMTKAFIVLLLTAAGLAAQASASTGTTAAKPAKTTAIAKKTTSASQPLTIPQDAVANADGTYSWTDTQGKNWTFVKTPFGVMKNESAAPAAATTSSSLAGVKAFEEGDKVRFERPSPFGAIKWEKNKTELTDEERSLVDSQAATRPAKQD
jgi:hypothetical protein